MNTNEAIEKHEELNQKLFDGDKLKPEVRQKAEDVVNEFLKLLAEDDVKLTVRDVILTGSNVSFNYNDQSDIDLHIVAQTSDFDNPDNLYQKLYNCYRRLFESKFDITFYGIPVEIYVETEDNPVISNGIYSVMYDKWIKEPQKSYIPNVDQKAIEKAAEPWLDKANMLIKELNDNTAKGEDEIDDYFEKLYALRHKGIYGTTDREFSEENLIFKEVRNSGVMEKLKELRNRIVANRLSLKEGIKYLDDDHEFLDYGTQDINGNDVIDVAKASTFETQDLLDGKSDLDGVVYEITDMTPMQYFELCGRLTDKQAKDIVDFIKDDERQIAHIKDVILKYGKKLPLPYISFSDNEAVSGQEGKHRMYALGEMYGWDEEFPVMLIQDDSAEKTLAKLLSESLVDGLNLLDEKTRRDYAVKIARMTHSQPRVYQNGLFEISGVKEEDAGPMVARLRHEDWIESVGKMAERYDFSKMHYMGIPARYFSISGQIKI